MSQNETLFRSSVYCIRDQCNPIVIEMYSPPGVKEKFVARVCAPDEKIRVTRGFNFIGTGRFADLPDTRLRVDVEELFKNMRCVGSARYNIALSAPTRRFNIRKQDGSPDPDSRVIVIFDVQCLSEVSLTTFGNLSLVEAPRTRRNAKASAPSGRETTAVVSERPKKKKEAKPKTAPDAALQHELDKATREADTAKLEDSGIDVASLQRVMHRKEEGAIPKVRRDLAMTWDDDDGRPLDLPSTALPVATAPDLSRNLFRKAYTAEKLTPSSPRTPNLESMGSSEEDDDMLTLAERIADIKDAFFLPPELFPDGLPPTTEALDEIRELTLVPQHSGKVDQVVCMARKHVISYHAGVMLPEACDVYLAKGHTDHYVGLVDWASFKSPSRRSAVAKATH